MSLLSWYLVGTLERLKGFIEKLIFFCHSHILVSFVGINYDKKFSSGRDFFWFMIDFLLRLTSINVTTEEKFLMVRKVVYFIVQRKQQVGGICR